MRRHDIPVLIVGGGPVGLGLAIELGWRGVKCLLAEQGDAAICLPRANAVDLRMMEFCRRWGMAEGLRAAGIPPDFPHAALYLTSLAGYQIARFDRPSHGDAAALAVSPERPQRCKQLFFDLLLRDPALEVPRRRVAFQLPFRIVRTGRDTGALWAVAGTGPARWPCCLARGPAAGRLWCAVRPRARRWRTDTGNFELHGGRRGRTLRWERDDGRGISSGRRHGNR